MSRPAVEDPLTAIRALYFHTTRQTVQRDLERAIMLFKQLTTDTERQRAAVYMDGLSQMRSEWLSQRHDDTRGMETQARAKPGTSKRPRRT